MRKWTVAMAALYEMMAVGVTATSATPGRSVRTRLAWVYSRVVVSATMVALAWMKTLVLSVLVRPGLRALFVKQQSSTAWPLLAMKLAHVSVRTNLKGPVATAAQDSRVPLAQRQRPSAGLSLA